MIASNLRSPHLPVYSAPGALHVRLPLSSASAASSLEQYSAATRTPSYQVPPSVPTLYATRSPRYEAPPSARNLDAYGPPGFYRHKAPPPLGRLVNTEPIITFRTSLLHGSFLLHQSTMAEVYARFHTFPHRPILATRFHPVLRFHRCTSLTVQWTIG